MKITLDENEKGLCARFMGECKGKFVQTAIEKGRTLTPWKEHNFSFFIARAFDELKELGDALQVYLGADGNNPDEVIKALKALQSECTDVSNFVWMAFVKADNIIKYMMKDQSNEKP